MKKELKLFYYKGFKIKDAFFSKIAIENNIDNTAEDTEIINNILNTIEFIENIYIAVKKKYRWLKRKDIEITSFFRCVLLNKFVGGSSTSDHKKGQAVDFKVNKLTPKQICDAIDKDFLQYDQLINEIHWVHASIDKIIFLNKGRRFLKIGVNKYKKIDLIR